MKIVFYFGVFARTGGIEEFTKDLAVTLRRAGMEVRIVCASLYNPALEKLKDAGIEVWRSPVYYGCRWNIPDYFLLPLALLAIKDADIVIYQKPFQKWFYRLIPHKPKHIYITSYRPREQFGNRKEIKKFFTHFDIIITQANSFKQQLQESGIQQPIYILPLIPPKIKSVEMPKRNEGILRIGIMGRIEPQKNPQYAIRIVHEIGKMLTDYHKHSIEIHFYGSGTLENSIRKLADECGIRAIFHGVYRREDVPNITAENDIFLITSITEGQCIVALEVLAGGRPLFATAVGALPEILNDEKRGTLLPKNNAVESAFLILHWLDKYQNLSREKIQFSYLEDFNIDKIKKQYVYLIKNLIV